MELTHRGFNVVIFVLSAIVLAYIVFPLTTILTFLDPSNAFESLTRPQVWNAFVLSLFTSTVSTSILCVIGIPFAYFLATYSNFKGKFIIRVIAIIPLVLPPLASGSCILFPNLKRARSTHRRALLLLSAAAVTFPRHAQVSHHRPDVGQALPARVGDAPTAGRGDSLPGR